MSEITLKRYQDIVEKELKEVMNELTVDSNLKVSMIYALLDGGKRLRPLLFLSLLESFGVDYHKYVRVACAIEMIHTYSLVHDDLPGMDNDTLRRGKPTTHIRFNEATAILCGDALLTDAFYVLTNLALDDGIIVKLIRALSYAAGSSGMVYGQQLDLEEEAAANIKYSEDVYHYKTAMMLQASIVMATIIIGNESTDFINLGSYLGQAFQIQDDILEVCSSSAKIGKDIDSDARNQKVTIVSLLGIKKAQALVDDYFNKIDTILINNNLKDSFFNEVINMISKREK